tara:strand:+ start:920 stop:1306 length:387 start_codon:yes stop_codon:yes gene_type:complete
MVHKNNKWNITKDKGEELAHRYIIEILKDSKNLTISLSELIILLNQRTKHIKIINHSKPKPLSVYMRNVYGNIINFFDLFNIYCIIYKDNDIFIKLMDEYIDYDDKLKEISKGYSEWIFIDNEEFVIV